MLCGLKIHRSEKKVCSDLPMTFLPWIFQVRGPSCNNILRSIVKSSA